MEEELEEEKIMGLEVAGKCTWDFAPTWRLSCARIIIFWGVDNEDNWILLGSKVFKRNGQSFHLGAQMK